ncbi:MAG: hypothetical protein H6613_12450 [Ignavibacteriales bacterium]|nr:hypothetical protein [Ignavibacteriales bacterium]
MNFKKILQSFKSMPILLPGVGAQGGSLEDVVNAFYKINNQNFIVNVSRGLLYIDDSNEFQKSIEKEIKKLNQIVLKSSSGF